MRRVNIAEHTISSAAGTSNTTIAKILGRMGCTRFWMTWAREPQLQKSVRNRTWTGECLLFGILLSLSSLSRRRCNTQHVSAELERKPHSPPLAVPPSEEAQGLRELTHTPYQPWCESCVRDKRRVQTDSCVMMVQELQKLQQFPLIWHHADHSRQCSRLCWMCAIEVKRPTGAHDARDLVIHSWFGSC